jgi:diguanylate cyclase (GGDEF)-like protein/PAS domain S-box-containing protein
LDSGLFFATLISRSAIKLAGSAIVKIDLSVTKSQAARAGRARSLIVIVWVFAGLVVLLLLLASYSMSLISASRAYVGGEGLWSKAQKQAVYALLRYTLDQQASDFQRYQSELAVILGDRQARLELEKPEPDLAVARQGFLQGKNHPDDIAGMIHLFRVFRQVPDIDRAITIWSEADMHIDRLIVLGERIQSSVQTGAMTPTLSRTYLQQIDEIDNALTPLEDAFSSTLAGAARKISVVLLVLMFAVASVLLAVAYLFSRRLVLQNADFQSALLDSETQLRALLQLAPLPILIVRREDAAVIFANERAQAQFRISGDTLQLYKADGFYVRPEERKELIGAVWRKGRVRDEEVELQDGSGGRFWALVSCQRIDFAGTECVLTTLTNIDERKRAQQELHHRAFHDELTGLPNRSMFMDALNRTRHRAERRNGVFLLFFVDLDDFKAINDTHGHRLGDMLLREVALRLRLCLREGDLVARLGGDEFVALVESEERSEDAAVIARKMLAALEPDYVFDDQVLKVTASIGISRYPHDGTELGELMRRADAAMYRAKAGGRNTFRATTTGN